MRHQLQDDPEPDGPGDEQEREQELRVRVGDEADPSGAALARQRRLQHDDDHQRHDRGADPERDWLLEGDQEELHRSGDASRRDAGRSPSTVHGGFRHSRIR